MMYTLYNCKYVIKCNLNVIIYEDTLIKRQKREVNFSDLSTNFRLNPRRCHTVVRLSIVLKLAMCSV